MICGTPWSPGLAFISFARAFIEALARGDFGEALQKLDMSGRKWTKNQVVEALGKATGGRGICSADCIKRSAAPVLSPLESIDGFRLVHRLPIEGKWSEACVIFAFRRSEVNSGYFHVILEAFQS